MKLIDVRKGDKNKAPTLVIYGGTKVGKTHFGAHAPSPVFICAENGLTKFKHIDRVVPNAPDDVFEFLSDIATQPHEFKTVVIDSLDWLEALFCKQICDEGGHSSMDDIAFGKLYGKLPPYWRKLFVALDAVAAKGINVICIAHEQIRRVTTPGADYIKMDMKLVESFNVKNSSLVQEWADVVAYAKVESVVSEGKIKSNDKRVLVLQPSATHVGGSRLSLPASIPLDWNEYANAIRDAVPLDIEEYHTELNKLRLGMNAKQLDICNAALEKAGNNPDLLHKLIVWARGITE